MLSKNKIKNKGIKIIISNALILKILLKFFKDKKFQNRMIEKQLQGEKVTISLYFLVPIPVS